MASIGSEQAPRSHWLTSRRAELNGAIARGRALFAGAAALVFESAWLFLIAKFRFDVHCLIFGRLEGR